MTEGFSIGWLNRTRLSAERFGVKASLLSAAAALDLPVPPGFAFPAHLATRPGFDAVLAEALESLAQDAKTYFGDDLPLLVALRTSAPGAAGGSAPAILNIGASEAALPAFAAAHGPRVAADLRRRLIQSFGTGALGLEGEEFEYALYDAMKEVGAQDETELSAADLERLSASC
ncbi:MAG: hypothetical protein AAGI70_03670, partial [Pseudomonadota bacterium]